MQAWAQVGGLTLQCCTSRQVRSVVAAVVPSHLRLVNAEVQELVHVAAGALQVVICQGLTIRIMHGRRSLVWLEAYAKRPEHDSNPPVLQTDSTRLVDPRL